MTCGVPDPTSSPPFFLQGMANRLPFILRSKKDRAEVVEWLDGVELALAALGPLAQDPETPDEWRPEPDESGLGYPPGHTYLIIQGFEGKTFRMKDLGRTQNLPELPKKGKGTLLRVFPWSRGRAVINIAPEKGVWTPLGLEGVELPPGVTTATEIVLSHDDGTPPTVLVVAQAPILVSVEGEPDPLAVLSALTAADLQGALLGGVE
ncbi:MAG: hypothetical protein ABIO70_10395 [Pseudomonadota bacterium]